MSKKWTRRGALGLIAGGTGLLAYGSGGFTQIEAERDASAAFVEDDEAALRIVGDDGDQGGEGERVLRGGSPFESGFTLEFTNQFDEDEDGQFESGEFEVELDETEGSVTASDGGGDVELVSTNTNTFENDEPFAPGQTASLEIDADDGAQADFDLVVDGTTNEGTRIELLRQVVVLADEDQIDDDADAFFIDVGGAWSFGTGQGSRGVAFEAENIRDEGENNIEVTEVQVKQAEATTVVTRVRNDTEFGEFGELDERASNTAFIDEFLDLEGDEITVGEDEENAVELDANLTLGPGEGTKNYGLTQFRDANDETVVMHRAGGGSADIRLVFDDGSERTYEFRNLRNQPP